MSLLSSIVLLVVAYVLLRIVGHNADTGRVGPQRQPLDFATIATNLAGSVVDVVTVMVRLLMRFLYFTRPHFQRVATLSVWHSIRDRSIAALQVFITMVRNNAVVHSRYPLDCDPPAAGGVNHRPRATVSEDLEWAQITDYAASESENMPALVEANVEDSVVSSVSSVSYSCCPTPKSASYLMSCGGDGAFGSNRVLPSGVQVCTTGRPRRVNLAETTSWYAVIVGREPGIYYSWHVAGPQVLGVSGQDYRLFRTEVEAADFFADQLMRRAVVKVVCPPFQQ